MIAVFLLDYSHVHIPEVAVDVVFLVHVAVVLLLRVQETPRMPSSCLSETREAGTLQIRNGYEGVSC